MDMEVTPSSESLLGRLRERKKPRAKGLGMARLAGHGVEPPELGLAEAVLGRLRSEPFSDPSLGKAVTSTCLSFPEDCFETRGIWLWWSKPFWGPILGEFTTHFRLPILVVGLNRMFTAGTIWILTHGHLEGSH